MHYYIHHSVIVFFTLDGTLDSVMEIKIYLELERFTELNNISMHILIIANACICFIVLILFSVN